MDVMTDTCGAHQTLILIKINDMVFVHVSLALPVVEMEAANRVYFHLYFLVIRTILALLKAGPTICSGAPQQQIMTKIRNMVFAKARDSCPAECSLLNVPNQ